MKRYARLATGVSVAALVLGGCYDLNVENTSGVKRDELLQNPHDVELYVAGIFPITYGQWHDANPWAGFSAAAEQLESSITTNGIYDFNRVPRDPVQNNIEYGNFGVISAPWVDGYEAIANATDMVWAQRTFNIQVINPSNGRNDTPRLMAFAHMIQGFGHMTLAMIYDQAAPIADDENLTEIPGLYGVPLLPVKPWQDVLAHGIRQLELSLAIMDTTVPFTLPRLEQAWFFNQTTPMNEMRQLIHSQIARHLVYGQRTPAERDALDWERVLYHLDRGLVADWGLQGWPSAGIDLSWHTLMNTHPIVNNVAFAGNNTSNSNRVRVDLKIVGPADVSGRYRQWLDLVAEVGGDTAHPPSIITPDQRIEPQSTSPDSSKAGSHWIRYTTVDPPDNIMPANRGRKYYSNYWFNGTAAFGNAGAEIARRKLLLITLKELNLLRAEAYIRLGRLQEAADLINVTRTDATLPGSGTNLPTVTVNGASGVDCVPQKVDLRADGSVACGTLWDALVYEKRLITYGHEPLPAFGDMRGWGCLEPGTPLHLPIPADQLELLGIPRYTFGGAAGTPGNAGQPDQQRCGILHLFNNPSP